MHDTLEDRDFTSIQERIAHFKAFTTDTVKANKLLKQKDNIQHESQPAQLKPFGGNHIKHRIPFALLDYIELVDWSGRHIDPKEKGHINKTMPKVLLTLNIEEAQWLESIQRFRQQYSNFAGSKQRLKQQAASNDVKWYKGAG